MILRKTTKTESNKTKQKLKSKQQHKTSHEDLRYMAARQQGKKKKKKSKDAVCLLDDSVAPRKSTEVVKNSRVSKQHRERAGNLDKQAVFKG